MKIGINVSFLRKTDVGIGQVTLNVVRELARLVAEKDSLVQDCEFLLYAEEDFDFDLPDNFQKKVFLPRFYRRDDLLRKWWWEKWLLPFYARRDGCDKLISLYQSATVVKKLKHLMLVHDTVWKNFPEYLGNARKRYYYRQVEAAIRQADGVLTISEFSRQEILKNIFGAGKSGVDRVAVEHIDADAIFREQLTSQQVLASLKKYQLLPEEPYFFYVGGFDVRKNVASLIEAYGIFYEKLLLYNKNVDRPVVLPKLVLAGNFHKQLVPLVTDLPAEIDKISRSYGVPKDCFKLTGFVQQADLPALYRSAIALCYPSLYEGFGLPVVEAFHCGCPVITSNSSSLVEIVPEEAALLIDPQDRQMLADKMLQLATQPELAQKIAAAGKKYAEQYSWEKFAKAMLNEILAK
jgi:glycosyltransferase involved in cell wall biosynthesis